MFELIREAEQYDALKEFTIYLAIEALFETYEEEYIEQLIENDEEKFAEMVNEAVRLIYRRKGNEIERAYRCLSGTKKGRIVNNPQVCVKKKDIKRSIISKRVNRLHRGARIRKMILSKRKALSKMVCRMNKQIEHRYKKKDTEAENVK